MPPQQLIALLSTASSMASIPTTTMSPRFSRRWTRRAAASARTSSAPIRQLSEAFVAYVRDLDARSRARHHLCRPAAEAEAAVAACDAAQRAKAPSLSDYVRDHGLDEPDLRRAAPGARQSRICQRPAARSCSTLNLERARALPAGKQRYILVNAAQQRLYMYEDGKPVDSMVVVVGKPKYPTPMMTAYVRFAALNPYWYVPPDLAASASRRRWSSRA